MTRRCTKARAALVAMLAFACIALAGCFDFKSAPPPNMDADPALLGVWQENTAANKPANYFKVAPGADARHIKITQVQRFMDDNVPRRAEGSYTGHFVKVNDNTFLCLQLNSFAVTPEPKTAAHPYGDVGNYSFYWISYAKSGNAARLRELLVDMDSTPNQVMAKFAQIKDWDDDASITYGATGDLRKLALTALPAEDHTGKIGVILVKSAANGVYIHDLEPDGLGDLAGLKLNDLVKSIDGKSTAGMTADEANAALTGLPGTTVFLAIDRETSHISFGLELERQRDEPGAANALQSAADSFKKLPPNPISSPTSNGNLTTLVIAVAVAVVLGIILVFWRRRNRRLALVRKAEAPPTFILNIPTQPAEKLDPEHPWPGLASFQREDADYFFGRKQETQELFRLIKGESLTLLFGKSGLGKTSLLNAGLFPLLRDKNFKLVYVRFDHNENAPSLATQFQKAVTEVSPRPLNPTLWEFFHQLRPGEPEDLPTPIVVIDQFEEIFTLGRESMTATRRSNEFFHQLADLVLNNCPQPVQARFESDRQAMRGFDFDESGFKIVLSMREEYLAYLEETHQPLRSLAQQRLRLTEMNGAQAQEAIVSAGRDLLQPSVAADIVRYVAGSARAGVDATADMRDMEITPALLSLVCYELNDRRLRQQMPQISADLVTATKDQILTDFYRNCFAELTDPVRFFVEDQLLTRTGYRSTVAVEDALAVEGVTIGDIQTLVERRLLRIDHRAGAPRLEITHDILVAPARAARDSRHASMRGWWGRLVLLGGFVDKLLTVIALATVAILALVQWIDLIRTILTVRNDPNVMLGRPFREIAFTDSIWGTTDTVLSLLVLFVILNFKGRFSWICRALIALALCGLGIFLLVGEFFYRGDWQVVWVFGPFAAMGFFQGIYLLSVFRRVFKIKRQNPRPLRT